MPSVCKHEAKPTRVNGKRQRLKTNIELKTKKQMNEKPYKKIY